jgi:subtilisin family serine protease
LWKNPNEVPGNRVDDDRNGYVDDVIGYNFGSDSANPNYSSSWGGSAHGTHVAGLAAAQGGNGEGGSGVIGTGARIMALNVFGSQSGASSSDIVNAIRYAADNGADVINLSLGGVGKTAAYEAAIGYAIGKGVTVFAAAGNERREVGPQFFLAPAAYAPQYKGLISVGSVDSSDSGISTFSNFSPTYVKLGAPGSENSAARDGLLSTWPGGGFQRIQGTSMATPVAAGTAALAISMMRARGYEPGPATVEGILAAGSPSLPDLTNKFHNGRVLNVKRIAEFIQASYPIRGSSEGPVDPGAPDDGACMPKP